MKWPPARHEALHGRPLDRIQDNTPTIPVDSDLQAHHFELARNTYCLIAPYPEQADESGCVHSFGTPSVQPHGIKVAGPAHFAAQAPDLMALQADQEPQALLNHLALRPRPGNSQGLGQ